MLQSCGLPSDNWRHTLCGALNRRNSSQRDAFRDVFSAYQKLLDNEKNTRTRSLELEREILLVQQQSPVTTGGTVANASLEQKVRDLQDELIAAYRLGKENEEMRKVLLTKEDELQDTKRALETAQEEKDLDRQEIAHLKETHVLLQKQITNLRSQLKESETKVVMVTKENRELIERVKNDKQGQIEQMNQLTDLLTESQRRNSGLPKVDEAKINVPTDSSLDYSSTTIFDMPVWKSSFNVTVPKEILRKIHAHKGEVSSLLFDNSGICLISGGSDKLVKNWKCDSGVLLSDYRGAKQAVMSVGFSPDMSMVIAAGNDRTARIYNRRTCRVLQTLTGHTNKIYSCSFDVDSSKVVTGSFDRTIRIWDVVSGHPKKTIMCYSSCNHVSVSPDGLAIASAHLDGHIRMWSLKTGEEIIDMNKIHKQQVTGVQFSNDGHLLTSSSRDNTILIIDVRTYKVLNRISHKNYKNFVNWSCACISPDAQYVCAGGSNGSVFVWGVEDGKMKKELKGHENTVTFVDWSSQGSTVASCDKNGQIFLWG